MLVLLWFMFSVIGLSIWIVWWIIEGLFFRCKHDYRMIPILGTHAHTCIKCGGRKVIKTKK